MGAVICEPSKFDYWRADYDSLVSELADVDWKVTLSGLNTDQIWNYLKRMIMELIYKYVSYNSLKRRTAKNEWITKRTVKDQET